MSFSSDRLKFAVGWALRHLLVSAIVVLGAAALVFGLLYPAPWRSILGIGGIFGLVVLVDLVCGPLLTLVLASPHKSRRERWLDLSLVASLQLLALGYGLGSVYSARPVALVFEVDRMVLVTANEVQVERLESAPEGMRQLRRVGLHFAGTRSASSSQEYLRSLEQSLGGVSPAMRPDWWTPFDETRSKVLIRAKPLSVLMAKRPEQLKVLTAAASKTRIEFAELRYLPLTSSKSTDWTALISPAGDVVGFAHVDSFD
jgi:hypothetical protein